MENPKDYREIYIASAAKLRFSSSLAVRDRVFRRQKERQHLHTRSAAISFLSSPSCFSDKLYLPSRCEELGLGEPMHARTESRGECRFTQNRSPFLRDCWPTGREEMCVSVFEREREREGREHPRDETAANAATYSVDVGAGHKKTYNLTDGG